MRHLDRCRTGVAVALALGLGAQAAGAQETATPDYKSLFVQSGGKTAQATLGAFCHPNDTTPANCGASPAYPLKTTGVVVGQAGGTVTLLLRADAGDVTWRVARIDGRGKEQLTAAGVARPASKRTKRRWRITLPTRLSGASDVLGFDVQYPNAYSSFEVGFKKAPATRGR